MIRNGFLIISLLMLVTFNVSAKSKGTETGGGGDPYENRVNEIRVDILDWINNKGAKDLILPPEIKYEDYEREMTEILVAKKVIITFVEEDHRSNPELMVSVQGMPKTCRGFISKIDDQPHILCHISRFKHSTDSEKYRLIHHEYAGLAGLEQNSGAASDYQISTQLTDYLVPQTVLKLAIKKSKSAGVSRKACFNFSETDYCVGDKAYLGTREGMITGINKLNSLISIKFNDDIEGTFEAKLIAAARGCLKEYCVGLDVVSLIYLGKVVAVNGFQQEITVQFEDGSISNMKYSKASIGIGCLEATCVGNTVYASNFAGVVVGINKYEHQISLRLEDGRYSTFKYTFIAVGKGCLRGFCVGDKAGYASFSGEIIGINPNQFLLDIKTAANKYMTVPIDESTVDTYTNEFDSDPTLRDINNKSDFIKAFNK